MAKPYILGLDIGTNSVGWAVVSCTQDTSGLHPTGLVALNSRIFQEMVDANTRDPKNQHRREKRLFRRMRSRHQGARNALIKLLQENQLLPAEINEKTCNDIDRQFAERVLKKEYSNSWTNKEKFHMSPFAMRGWAMEDGHYLERHEFGRTLLQLQKRRGYFSNRGAKYIDLIEHFEKDGGNELAVLAAEDDEGEIFSSKDKEEQKKAREVLGGIDALEKSMAESECATVGEFIWKESLKSNQAPKRITRYSKEVPKNRKRKDVSGESGRGDIPETEEVKMIPRGFYATREQYKEEFKKLWDKHSDRLKLSDTLHAKVHCKIFYQRRLESPPPKCRRIKHLSYNEVGKCSFLIHKPRAPKALLEAQEFRTLQYINNIQINKKPLSDEQRSRLLECANDVEQTNKDCRITWMKVREKLGYKPKSKEVNYEPGQDEESQKDAKSGLIGNRTAKRIVEIIGLPRWQGYTPEKKGSLVKDLLEITNKKELYEHLINTWNLSKGQNGEASKLAFMELEPGYMKHCSVVIRKLLPHLRRGMTYYEACKEEGYVSNTGKGNKDFIGPNDIPNIANPIVQKALFEVRRVVNAVISKYGQPSEIRIELTRDLKASKKRRAEIKREQNINRERNTKAEEEIREIRKSDDKISRKDRDKYKMWKYEQNYQCIYCMQSISSASLFGGEAEVDHIWPASGFHQNYMNTVVTCKSCNQKKGRETPYQAWGDTEIFHRIKKELEKESGSTFKLPKEKIKRILNEDYVPESTDTEDFVKRQLNDARHISTVTNNILSNVLKMPVQVSTGAATAELRRLWGLNTILPVAPTELSEEGQATTQKDGKKKKRLDHRHHAIDALVVALTDAAVYKDLMCRHRRREKEGEWPEEPLAIPEKWEDAHHFYEQVKEKIIPAIVSHSPQRKISGALHRENPFGRAHYLETFEIKFTKAGTLKKKCKNDLADMLAICSDSRGEADVDGKVSWIPDKKVYKKLKNWWDNENPSLHNFAFPMLAGTQSYEITVARRCYVKRTALKELWDVKKKKWKLNKWTPGKGKWIKEKTVHEAIVDWTNKGNTKDDLAKNPPMMSSAKSSKKPNPIKKVKLAQVMDKKSIVSISRKNHSEVFEHQNHHHVEIFCCENKTESRFVTMLEAAERVSRKEPIVDRNPDVKWGDGWKFVFDLAINDMVLWDENYPYPNPKVQAKVQAHKDSGKLVYRVQYMSGSNQSITFRHHSAALSGAKDFGGVTIDISKIHLHCRKILVTVLGRTCDDD